MRIRERNEQIAYTPKKQLSINLAQDLSDHAAELLWGQGFVITHKNEKANKRIQELLAYNHSQEYFFHKEKLLSLYGNVYETIDLVDGKPTWTIADPTLNSIGNVNTIPTTDGTIYGLGRALITDVVAVIWKKITFGTISFPIKEIHTANKVERIFFGENNKRVVIAHVNKVLPKELQLQEVWEHNLGLINGKLATVKWNKNIPTYNSVSYKDGYKGDALQVLVDKTLCELYHETETNRTRIIGNLDETTYNQIMKNGELAEINKSDFLVNVKFKNSTGQNENTLIPIIADPKFEQYWLSIQKAKDEYFQLGGYSPLGDGSSEKTATENLLMKTNDYQTTKKKRNQRYVELFDLLESSIYIDIKLGFGNIFGDINKLNENLSIEIMENKVMDSLQEMQNYSSMYELGVMSRIEMIAKIRGINIDEAKKIKAEIDAELKADNETMQKDEQQQDNQQEGK